MKDNIKEERDAIEKELRESVWHYMELAGFALGQPTLLAQHDALCRLLVFIAEEHPCELAKNPGDVRLFPKVKILDPKDLCYGDEVELEYGVFEGMFDSEDDYKECTGIDGGHIYFLSLALWYEVCMRRDKMRVSGTKFKKFQKEINEAVEQALEREQKMLEARNTANPGRLASGQLAHFSVEKSDAEVLAIAKGFREVEWKCNRVKTIGFFEGEVTDEEWLSALKGPTDTREGARRKIPLKTKYICRSFVAQYLDGNYTLAEKVFCLKDGKEIKNLNNTNISKNKDVCDPIEGKIAKIIREAMRNCGH